MAVWHEHMWWEFFDYAEFYEKERGRKERGGSRYHE